jgi:hypothetical protein
LENNLATKFTPNSELVAVTYIRSLSVMPSATSGVGTTLPEATSSWTDGFIVAQVVGGSSDRDVPVKSPLIQLDIYVPSINTSKPQWGKAATIAADIVEKLYAHDSTTNALQLGATFKDARVSTAYAVSEPRRITNDPAGHARYTVDVVLNWVTVEPPTT